jgi:hypothetical protein
VNRVVATAAKILPASLAQNMPDTVDLPAFYTDLLDLPSSNFRDPPVEAGACRGDCERAVATVKGSRQPFVAR